ncbi:MAG: LPS-assembly protein LptD [Pseudohongiellaceae bacterium]|nr:LPS-assembly protein LptD [Pseudohongiellaceae bacterium]
MQFRKRLLCTNISVALTTGLLIAHSTSSALAQEAIRDAGQWSCIAGPDGGWLCQENPEQALGNSTVPTVTAANASRRQQGGRSTGGVPMSRNDWLDAQQMTPEQRASLEPNCCGAFIEPERRGIDGELIDPQADTANAPTLFEAPGDVDQSSDNIIQIQGQVNIQQGSRTVSNSSNTEIDQNAERITLSGDIEFREPGVLLTGTSAVLDQSTSSNQIEQANYVLHDYGIHGSATTLVYDSEGEVLAIENGEFSRCEPGEEFWKLKAQSMVLDTINGIGTATAVSLRIKDVPVFYYPYSIRFPLSDQRSSGFLAPSIGSTSDGGLDIEVPYYFNLAPHYDATLTPRLISDRGVMAAAEFRYLAESSMNTLSLALLPDDKLYDEATATIPGSDSPPVDKRWFVGLQHEGQYGDHWSTNINYEAVSDDDYFHDLGSTGLNVASRTHLQRMGQVSYRNTHWYGSTKVQRIDIIDPFVSAIDFNTPYDRLPEVSIGNRYSIGGLQLGIDANYVSFDRQLDESILTTTDIDNGALVTGTRTHVEPQISYPIRGAAGFFVPTAKYKYTSWDLDEQALGTEQTPDRGLGVFSLDTGLVFERGINWGGTGYTQTLEPRLFYLFSEQEDQSSLPTFDTAQLNFSFGQLFREDRFSGHDRIGDANQLSVAIGSRIFDLNGQERASLNIGQIFYFEDRIVSLDSMLQNWITLQARNTDTSALVSEFMYQFNDSWRLTTDVQWNDDRQELDEGSFAFRYQADANHIFNLAYRYRRLVDLAGPIPAALDPRIKQTDVSAIWPLSDNWRLLARWNYDHSNSRNLDTFAGVEYSNCCTTIRLVAREWIDEDEYFLLQDETNTGIFFQLTLNGFGNLSGGGVSRLLSDGILGFKEYEANE